MARQCDHLLTCFLVHSGTYPQCTRKAKFLIGENAYCKKHAAAGMALWYKSALEEIDKICCSVPFDVWEELDMSMNGFLTAIHGTAASALEDSGHGIITPVKVQPDL